VLSFDDEALTFGLTFLGQKRKVNALSPVTLLGSRCAQKISEHRRARSSLNRTRIVAERSVIAPTLDAVAERHRFPHREKHGAVTSPIVGLVVVEMPGKEIGLAGSFQVEKCRLQQEACVHAKDQYQSRLREGDLWVSVLIKET
jgi:hypothetical protein